MHLAMVSATEGNRELITDLAAECRGIGQNVDNEHPRDGVHQVYLAPKVHSETDSEPVLQRTAYTVNPYTVGAHITGRP